MDVKDGCLEGSREYGVVIIGDCELKCEEVTLVCNNDGFDVDKALLAAFGVFACSLLLPKFTDGVTVRTVVDLIEVVGFREGRRFGVLLCIMTVVLGSSELVKVDCGDGKTSARLVGENVLSAGIGVG